MAIPNGSQRPGEEVRIQLFTREPDIEFPEPVGPILIPTHLRRAQLSEFVNQQLQLAANEKTIPFTFLVDGQILRNSLDNYLTDHGLSSENTLSVEYVRAKLPPEPQATFPHDAWVGAVDILSSTSQAGYYSTRSGHERILSGSHDGCVRVWNLSGDTLVKSDAANVSVENGNVRLQNGSLPMIHSAKFVTPTCVVAGGMNGYLRLWNYVEDESALSANLTPSLELHGHETMGCAINSIAVNSRARRILSGSDDNTALLWSSDPKDAEAPKLATRRVKRQKHSPSTTEVPCRGPLTALRGHKRPVHAVSFSPTDGTVAYTASADWTLKTWDLTTAQVVHTRTPSQHAGLSSVCVLSELSLIATGTDARTIVLVDPREGATRSSVLVLKGHQNTVSSLAAEPEGRYGLCSGSHDGCVRVWDVRNTRGPAEGVEAVGARSAQATFRLPRHASPRCDKVPGGEGVAVFDVCWDKTVGIVSAGEDKRVQIDKAR